MKPIGDLLKTSERIQNIVLEGFDPISAKGFTQIPNLLLEDAELSSNAKVVYAKLLSYVWHAESCYPGQDTMAGQIGISQPTVNRAIQELEDSGWLEVRKRGQGKTNVYVLKYVVKNKKIVDNLPQS